MAGNDSFTKILLSFDGTDTSTSISDINRGGSAHTWTANGNAQLDTGITKFGTATLLMDGTGDYISTPDSADFALGAGDFTIDFWFNVNTSGNGTLRGFAGQCNSTVTAASTSFRANIGTTNVISGIVADAGTGFTITGTTAITTTGWHHYAFLRTGNVLKLFLDGVQEGGDLAFTGTVNNSTNAFAIGRRGEQNNSFYFGSMDEFRLSVGIARWTTNFTPPTLAYGPDDLAADAASYAWTGQVAILRHSDIIIALPGSYNWSGQPITLNHLKRLSVDPIAYDWTGQNADLSYGFTISVAFGEYQWIGSDAALLKSFKLSTDTIAYLWTGVAVALEHGYELQAEPGSYEWLGTDIDFIFNPPPGPITDLYNRIPASKVKFWRQVHASSFMRRP